MIEQLKRTFPHMMTTIYDPTNDHYKWFKTPDDERFGLAHTIPPEQLALIAQLFEPIDMTIHDVRRSPMQQKWYAFLFDGKADVPFSDVTAIRFYYVRMQQPVDEMPFIEEAFQGAFERATWLTLSPSEGILVEENATTDSVHLFEDVLQSLIGDMMIQFFSYVGQLHLPNVHLQRQFSLERQFFHIDSPHQMMTTFYEVFNRRCMHTSISSELFSTALRHTLEQQETQEMIRTFCACNLNISLAAKQLFVHRNSLQYRIERLYQLTGVDIRDFAQAMFLILALQLIDQPSKCTIPI